MDQEMETLSQIKEKEREISVHAKGECVRCLPCFAFPSFVLPSLPNIL
jgi:hypothetical protein